MSEILRNVIAEAPEIIFASAAVCGIEILPHAYLEDAFGESWHNIDTERHLAFLSLWFVWLITGGRFAATVLAYASTVPLESVAVWILVGVTTTLLMIVSVLVLSRMGWEWLHTRPAAIRFVLRLIPVLFVVGTLLIHLV